MDECRLRIRPPQEIERFIELLLEYYQQRTYVVVGDGRRGIQDRESPVVLPRTMEVWNNNKSHVLKGCLNDPPDFDVYYPKGPNRPQVCSYLLGEGWCVITNSDHMFAVGRHQSQSLIIKDNYWNARGTSQNEGYHHHLEMKIVGDQTGLALVHAILTIFNFIWNQTMAISHKCLYIVPDYCACAPAISRFL